MVTFNCKSIKRSLESVRRICKTADIVALQETWLLPHDIPMLGTVDDNFEYTGKSAVDTSAGILVGRPYGGVALLWRKGIFQSVSLVECKSVRLTAIKASLCDRSIIVFSVYMPTDSVENMSEFTDCLSEMSAIVNNSEVEAIYMLGDFNSHPNQPFWKELCVFCSDHQWLCSDFEKLHNNNTESYTYISDINGSRRWLDHCVVTRAAWQSVYSVSIDYGVFWSDHLPLTVVCNLNTVMPKIKQIAEKSLNKVIWRERNDGQIGRYHDLCNNKLRDIDFPEKLLTCADKMCNNIEHRRELDKLYSDIVCVLSESAIQTCEQIEARREGRVVGWNKHVHEAHREARIRHQLWVQLGRPPNGQVWDEMRESQRVFRGRLKWCQKNQDQIKMDILASQRSSKNFAQFWKTTNKLNLKPSLPVSVAGLNVAEDVANMFKDRFVVSSPLGPSNEGVVAEACHGKSLSCFSAKQVTKVLNQMCGGRSPGHDSLSIEHLKHAGVHLPRLLAMLFTLCISHSYLPPDMMKTVVVPIVKNRTGDISDPSNYRPISLATVIAKVLDSLLDKELGNILQLHDAQFGFRPKLSTESAILGLKQTVRYYTDRNTPIYACFLDLSKAFDLVAYDVLWGKLREAGISNELLEIFKYWYTHQLNCVRWGGSLSETYRLECGVRQGGLTSPKLFNLYINELIAGLSSMRVGCWIDNVCVNNLSYADDMVLLGPTAGSIRELLHVCERYATDHGLTYNVNKSVFMVFETSGRRVRSDPVVILNGLPLKRVDKFKYLGHFLTGDLKDDEDIDRERRALAVRANMLIHRFARCSSEAKITLFKAYCQSFYTSGLWVRHTKRSLDALRIQYNNCFRMLLGLPRYCSASGMFALAHTDDFYAIMRKKTYSILARARSSSNSILSMFSEKYDAPWLSHAVEVLVRGPHS